MSIQEQLNMAGMLSEDALSSHLSLKKREIVQRLEAIKKYCIYKGYQVFDHGEL